MRTGVVWVGLATPLIFVACGGRTLDFPVIVTDSGDESVADAGIDSPLDAADEDGMVSVECPPAASIQAGVACSVASGLVCRAALSLVDCSGRPLYVDCTCATGAWLCVQIPAPDCPPPPSTVCPSGTDVMDGKSCSGIKVGLTCRGNPTMCNGATFYDALQCDGVSWNTLAATVCGIDGG